MSCTLVFFFFSLLWIGNLVAGNMLYKIAIPWSCVNLSCIYILVAGNTSLCSATVRQYAREDNEILVQHDSSCYTVVPHKVSWTHAESICNHRGGHLFHVSSASENAFIYNVLNSQFNHAVWMGFHDRAHEERFTWTSGNLYWNLFVLTLLSLLTDININTGHFHCC